MDNHKSPIINSTAPKRRIGQILSSSRKPRKRYYRWWSVHARGAMNTHYFNYDLQAILSPGFVFSNKNMFLNIKHKFRLCMILEMHESNKHACSFQACMIFSFVFIPSIRVGEHAWNGEELGLMKVFCHMTFESHEHCLHRTTLRLQCTVS